MFMNTLKVILAIGLAVAFVAGTGFAFLAMSYDSAKSEKEKENNTAQSKKGSKLDKEDSITKEISDRRKELDYLLNLRALLKERVEAAKTEVQARTREFEAGKGILDFLIAASRRLLVAEWELSDKKEDQLAALKAHFDRMKAAEDLNQERFGAGRIAVQDLQQTKYYRLEAEIWLEKAKMGKFKLDVHSMP
jgi:outer membrane protein TolC